MISENSNSESRISNLESRISKVGIIGSGTMGIGIAQVASTAGCEVFLYDANSWQTEKSLLNLKSTLNKLVEKQKISAEKSNDIFNKIKFCADLPELKDCDLVIEAIIENKEIKRPENWGGYLAKPYEIEFWQGRPNRLHDRIIYELQQDFSWKISRLAP